MGTVQSFQVAVQARSQKWGDAVIGFLNSSLWDFPLVSDIWWKISKTLPLSGKYFEDIMFKTPSKFI